MIGISLGASVAFQIAIDYPEIVDGLVIINGSPEGPRRRTRRTSRSSSGGPFRARARHARDRAAARGASASGARARGVASVFVERWAENDPELYLSCVAAIMNWSARDRLASLTVPCLVVSGDQDYTPVSFKEEYLRELPSAELVVIANSRHMTTHDQPQALNSACCTSWIDGVWRPPIREEHVTRDAVIRATGGTMSRSRSLMTVGLLSGWAAVAAAQPQDTPPPPPPPPADTPAQDTPPHRRRTRRPSLHRQRRPSRRRHPRSRPGRFAVA